MNSVEQGEVATFLVHLPIEVRYKIYCYLLVEGAPIEKVKVRGASRTTRRYRLDLSAQLLRSCATIRNEALPVLLGKNIFVIDDTGDLNRLKDMTSIPGRNLYNHIVVSPMALCNAPIQSFLTNKRAVQLNGFRGLKRFTYHGNFDEIPQDIIVLKASATYATATLDFLRKLMAKHPTIVTLKAHITGGHPQDPLDPCEFLTTVSVHVDMVWDLSSRSGSGNEIDEIEPMVDRMWMTGSRGSDNDWRKELTVERYAEGVPYISAAEQINLLYGNNGTN